MKRMPYYSLQKIDGPAGVAQRNYFSEIPPEVIDQILWMLDAPELLKLMMTSRRMFHIVTQMNWKWRALCQKDFDVFLSERGKFTSFHEIYKLLYCSRILLASYTYARYFDNLKQSQIPNWLMHWAVLSRNAPLLKYGLHRIKRRVKGHYLKRLNDITYGQIRKVFDFSPYDLLNMHPSRVQRGTIYFSYHTVQYAGARKYGSIQNYFTFLLNKCHRSRGYVQRYYEKVLHSNPLIPL